MTNLEEKIQKLPVELQREVDDFIDFLAHKHESLSRSGHRQRHDTKRLVTIKALNGKEYTLEPLSEDPSEFTYHAGRETILEAIRGESP